MSCDTLNQGSTGLSVSMASLPEGFCPTSMQELANAIAARLIVSPNQAFTSFATGSVEPTSNVGPWLKDCLSWFVFDDATARYIPITKGGFDSLQYFTTPGAGSFIVPDFIFKLKIHAWGAGGGGSGTDGGQSCGSGGGGGAQGLFIVNVVPGQIIPYTIGIGGTGGATGTDGTDTVILGRTSGGGKGATALAVAGIGGVSTGFDVNMNGQNGLANSGGASAGPPCSGGDAGGWGGKGGQVIANAPSAASKAGITPGGGGSGGATVALDTGGAGASGGLLFEY